MLLSAFPRLPVLGVGWAGWMERSYSKEIIYRLSNASLSGTEQPRSLVGTFAPPAVTGCGEIFARLGVGSVTGEWIPAQGWSCPEFWSLCWKNGEGPVSSPVFGKHLSKPFSNSLECK